MLRLLTLLGIIDGPGFPNYRHLNVTWVFKLLFNLLLEVVGQGDRLLIGNLGWFDNHANLAASLDCLRMFNAAILVGQLL